MALMQWHIVSREQFKAGTPVDTSLYFITGENVIYRGSELFTKGMEFYATDLPTNPAPNRIYVNSTTLEGKMWDGTEWKQVIRPIDATVTADGANAVTGKAVADYVKAEIEKITGADAAVLTGASWDADNHVFTFAKGTGTPITITLDGVGTKLEYVPATGALSLKDASGNQLGDAIMLDLERFVHGGEYDTETKNIILYFNDEKTDKVEIPAAALVDTYTAESTATVDLTVTANKFKAAVKISTAEGNALEAKEDGLYVAKTDISGKMDKDTDAVKDNIAIFDENGNAVDSGKSFDDIASNVQIFVGVDQTIEEATTGKTPQTGDFLILKKTISEGKFEHTAYVYNTDHWEAMDGNYSAENVYFPEDLLTTSAIGNITLTNGQATIAKGNLKEVWNRIFVKAMDPTVTQPSVSVTLKNAKAYEVGSTFTPEFTATLNAGSYQYGPATGITADTWEITDTDSHTAAANAGSFDAFTVGDDTNYAVTAKATYNDGAVPKNNIGELVTAKQIKAGNKSATSAKVTGFRNSFYGALASKDAAVDSAVIRGLTASGKALANGAKFDVKIKAGDIRVVVAYPATLRDITEVKDENGMNANITSAFTGKMVNVDVEGAGGYTAKAYKVYVVDFSEGASKDNIYHVTI